MVTTNGAKFYEYKANGLVKDVFSQQGQLDALKGTAMAGVVVGSAGLLPSVAAGLG